MKTDKQLSRLKKETLVNELEYARQHLVELRANLDLDPDNSEIQEELEDLDIYIATITDLIEGGGSEEDGEGDPEEEATVKDAAENEVPEELKDYIKVELIKGQRFDPTTGKPQGVKRTQFYTYKQFLQLKRNAGKLGITFKVLYVPESLKDQIK